MHGNQLESLFSKMFSYHMHTVSPADHLVMPLVVEESEGKVVGNQTHDYSPRAECTGMVAVGMEDVKVVAQL